MRPLINLAGVRFGRLVVKHRVANDKPGAPQWYCECDCGSTCTPYGGSLRAGETRSCGCLRQIVSAAKTTHGHRANGESRTYISWKSMKARCYSQRNKDWKNYGGRGVEVCERWIDCFENFLADMGIRPPGKSLDRYPNNSGDYEPGNCRWATPKEQTANRRNS